MNSYQAERLQWVGLTMLGLVAGLALTLPLGVPIFAVVGAMAGTPLVLGIVGLALGAAQWPIIRRHLSRSWLWIVASAFGMALGLTAGVTLVEQVGRALTGGPVNFRMLGVAGRSLSFGVIGVLGGVSLGLAQWLVLRPHAPNCKAWIRVNALSLGAGLACGSILADALVLKAGSLASTAVLLLMGSSIAGSFTARALARIFSQRDRYFSAQ
jgi:hypothetical protein